MLVSLAVKNLALIDASEMEFQEGLNIMSGETGAGKSILMGAVNLALGAKAEKDLIREGEDYALVELVFRVKEPRVAILLEEYDLPAMEEDSLLISRKILPGRSVFKINGENATAKQVKGLAAYLLDIHGQHEHQSLLSVTKQQEILDLYAGEAFSVKLAEYEGVYKAWKKAISALEEVSLDEETRLREMELAAYEIREITDAGPVEGEDETLEQTYQKMLHGRKILDGVQGAMASLEGERGDGPGEMISRALREITSVAHFDEALQPFAEQLNDLEQIVEDLNRGLADYAREMEFSESDFAQVESRLNLLNHLKAKYGRDILSVLSYLQRRQEEYEKLENLAIYQEKMRAEKENLEKQVLTLCAELSEIRKKAAAQLSRGVVSTLTDLNFLHVEFEVQVQPDKEHITAIGYDQISFLISTNPGNPIKPLAMVASGGELSRIMLGLKTLLADKDAIETLIFDEIDAGISGKTAWKVSEKLGQLSKKHQVICITHLPQIAAMADAHFFIEKQTDLQKTTTTIRPLSGQERVEEIARMGSGDVITQAALDNAKALLAEAGKY